MNSEQFDRIESYLQGTLPESEKRAFEADLLTDAILRSNMDLHQKLRLGLRALAIEKELDKARLRTQLPATTGIVRPLSSFRVWGIAASILVMIGIGWGIGQWNENSENEQLAVLAEQEMVDTQYKSMPFDSLQKLTDTASSTRTREKAEWYVALAYLKQAKQKEARNLLTKIAETPQHTYHQKARKLLEKAF